MSRPWLDRVARLGRDLLIGTRDLVYPGLCLLCGQPLPSEQRHFCDECRRDVFTDRFAVCPHCAGTIGPFAVVEGRCTACRDERFPFEKVIRLGPYAGMLREVILRLKTQGSEGLAELLGECWAEQAAAQFKTMGADAIVPVPLHWMRRWRRGYNQSAALCHGLALRLRLPLQPSWLRRVRNTPQQSKQTPAGRKANVRGAFVPRRREGIKGRTVLLVDDVMTTGATVAEATRALFQGGASRVVVAVLARAQG